jgi:small subunit ribosomal protein S6
MAKKGKSPYDLMVLIDADVPEDRRTSILEGIRTSIRSGDGDLKGDADWGVRRMAYEIDHRPEAYYHLFQFESGTELLRQLEHNLSIDDAVLRHRIIRLEKGIPETTPRPAPPRHAESEHRGTPEGAASESPAEPAPAAAAPAQAAPAPAAPEPAATTAESPSAETPQPSAPAES